MTKYKYADEENIPVYNVFLDGDNKAGIKLISLVDKPAIEMKGMYFKKSEKNKEYHFKVDKDQQKIVGPVLIPGKKIYRNDEDGEYFLVFDQPTIKSLVEKFNSDGDGHRINIDHSNKMVDGFINQNWIVEDTYYDKSKMYGFSVPVGTWMVEVKIEDEELWNSDIKELGKFGFSVEALLGQKPANMSEQLDMLSDEEVIKLFNDLKLEYTPREGLFHPNCLCMLIDGKLVKEPGCCDICKSMTIDDLI